MSWPWAKPLRLVTMLIMQTRMCPLYLAWNYMYAMKMTTILLSIEDMFSVHSHLIVCLHSLVPRPLDSFSLFALRYWQREPGNEAVLTCMLCTQQLTHATMQVCTSWVFLSSISPLRSSGERSHKLWCWPHGLYRAGLCNGCLLPLPGEKGEGVFESWCLPNFTHIYELSIRWFFMRTSSQSTQL